MDLPGASVHHNRHHLTELTAGDKKGAVPLKDVGSVRAEDYKDKKHCFKVMTSSRSYYIIATSHEEMKGWIDSLTQERKKFGETSHERMKRSGYNPPALAAKQVRPLPDFAFVLLRPTQERRRRAKKERKATES
jgi:hypothetical protein